MTASPKLREDVLNGFYGKSKQPVLNALANFNKVADGAGTATPASVSKKYFADTRTLAASGTLDLDLAGGVTDANGVAFSFAKVHAIYVRAAAGNTNKVVVGGAAANGALGPFGAAAHTVAVDPDSTLFVSSKAGWNVTAATADLLKIANSAGGSAVTFEIVIVGE